MKIMKESISKVTGYAKEHPYRTSAAAVVAGTVTVLYGNAVGAVGMKVGLVTAIVAGGVIGMGRLIKDTKLQDMGRNGVAVGGACIAAGYAVAASNTVLGGMMIAGGVAGAGYSYAKESGILGLNVALADARV